MRWNNLSNEEQERARLPGYRDGAVVRHFEAPGSISTRFYEVHAKSVLNHVPPASRMPFRWTINPYRGCTHACLYCVAGDTPVLMGDGGHKPISDLDIGDRIYGTVRSGPYRRYAVTEVLNKWISVKPAYRITLADGAELVASADHRFLSNRGWKHVLNTERGVHDRPHLTLHNSLVGTGAFAPQPEQTPDYRRGYLCGTLRGDGHIGSYSHDRRGGGGGDIDLLRLALADTEALARSQRYMTEVGLETREWLFARAAGSPREIRAIGSGRRSALESAAQLIEWPVLPSLDWCRGFLAGIFDAEGSCGGKALRISNKDPEILGWTEACARRLGFNTVLEPPHENGVRVVRIRGGLSEELRFFHLTDPAIKRKRSIEGQMVKTFTDLGIEAIEPLGRALPLYDITTGTGDFIANGVVSHNCFARPTHRYLDFDAGRDFEREIIVKVNTPERLRVELARPSWEGEHVALGTNTDPYQWAEGRYKLMPGIWEALRDARNPCSVLTKSPLLLRDLGLMKEIAAVTEFGAALSVPTLDEKAWRATEPHTPHPRARLEAVAELTRAGIRTGILVAPLMPGINDAPEQVEPILELAAEAGAAYVTAIPLHLRGETKGVFLDWMREQRPELIDRYERLYGNRAYLRQDEQQRLSALVKGGDRRPWERMRGRRTPPQSAPAAPRRRVEQQRLF